MTKINDSCYKDVNNMYVMSDIHGDLDLLIINLRDCAKVIKQKNNSNWRELAKLTIPNLSFEQLIDIDRYDCLFNFEWCGNDKWIVIIGDIIDNYRQGYTINDKYFNDRRQDEIEYEELKIILFLNKLNKVAQSYNGAVVKLIGNHEDMNINNDNITRYVSSYTLNNNFYTIKRKKLFSIYNDLFNHKNYKDNQGKKYVIFKINNFIFLHGGLNKDIVKYFYNKINKNTTVEEFIDYINNEYNQCINNKYNTCKFINDVNGLLWYRELSSSSKKFDHIFCDEIDNIFTILCNNNQECAKTTYLVVGHCIQSDFSTIRINNNNSTHSIIKKNDNVHIIDGPIVETNIEKELNFEDKKIPKIFGITASCIKNENSNLARIYRVDIGASRAFDTNETDKHFIDNINNLYNILYNIINKSINENNIDIYIDLCDKYKIDKSKVIKSKYVLTNNKIINENKIKILIKFILLNNKDIKRKIIKYMYRYYVSRLPQILYINYDNNIPNTKIIRSTLKNAISNMIRNNVFPFNDERYNYIFEDIVNQIDNNNNISI